MGKQEDGIPSQMLDFLSGMEENWDAMQKVIEKYC